VLQGARLVLGENDDLAGPLREAFEHWRGIVPESLPVPAGLPGGRYELVGLVDDDAAADRRVASK
jgi:hypothetical protein